MKKAYCSTTLTAVENLLKRLFHSRLLDMKVAENVHHCLRWPDTIYLPVGYIFELRVLA